MKTNFKINNYMSNPVSNKIGMLEIEGLETALRDIVKPIEKHLASKMYWRDQIQFEPTEYKSRDGFYAHSHNLGGLEFIDIIPQCEEYNFDYLTFGTDIDDSGDSSYEDAKLRIWLKLESIDNGTLKFYLYLGGGNADAPYFRTTHGEETYFEAEFQAKSIKGIKRASSKHIKALLKVMDAL